MVDFFSVLRPFDAMSISGSKRRLSPGEVVSANLSQLGSEVTIELDMTFLVVDFLTFNACCKRIESRGVSGRPFDL
jgi:hypothetical protein